MGDEVIKDTEEAADEAPSQNVNIKTVTDIDTYRERVTFLKIPVDIVTPDILEHLAFTLLSEEKGHNIVLLSVWDLLRARRNAEYRDYVKQAVLVIPVSKSIIKGIQFLNGKQAVRYMPFDFIITLLRLLDHHEYSSYFLGGKKRVLLKAEGNIRATFPGLSIVGRFPGSFRRQNETIIIEAIRKASPSLLLVGKGVRGGECWIARNSHQLGNGLRLWGSDILEVFAGHKQHPPRKVFDLGLEWIGYSLRNPLRLLRFFPFIYFNCLLLVYKIFKKN